MLANVPPPEGAAYWIVQRWVWSVTPPRCHPNEGGATRIPRGQCGGVEVAVVTVVVAVLGLSVAALSSLVDRLPVSEPLLALVVGVLVGPQLLGWVSLSELGSRHHELHEVSLVLLAVSMMAIALRYPFTEARRRWRSVAVLLVVLMPVMALASTGVLALGLGGAGVGLATALAVGAALCPTDPVLSSSVVTGEPAERDVAARTRQLLSLESGANDGLALPLVVLAVAAAGPLAGRAAAAEVAREVLGALVLGLVAGLAAARAVRAGERQGDTSPAAAVVFTLVLALGVLGAAELLRVGGVLAVLTAGLALNATWSGGERVRAATLDEAVNKYAVLPVFVLLGAALPWSRWADLGWWPVIGTAVGVVLLRRLPWLLLLAPLLRLARRDALFLGWFGPIGVSAVYYLTEVIDRVPGSGPAVAAGAAVVALSTVVHGLTGSPGRAAYARAGGD